MEMKKPSIKTDVEKIKDSQLYCEIIKDEKIDLTIPVAFEILDLKVFEGERDVSDTHVQELYDEMAKGRFRSEHVIIAVCHLDDEIYRINGQHTCWARTNMPKGYSCLVRKITYKVKTKDELKKLYGVFDPQYSARSKGHLTKMLLVGNDLLDGVWPSIIGTISTGFKFWHWGETPDVMRRQGHNEIAEAVLKQPELFKMVAGFYQAHNKQLHLTRRQSVLAAMFECWDKKPTIAEEFWKPVADGLGLTEKNDPRYMLREWLMSHVVDSIIKGKQTTNAEEMYRICINAWNRWRAGEKIQTLRTTAQRMKAR